jgi:uncharacterized glyoxalase superfamily protein PhnB
MLRFFEEAFGIAPKYANDEFGEIVLPSGFRLAVFAVVGKTKQFFDADGARGTLAIGVTVTDVDATWARIEPLLARFAASASGPPKEHPWGEKSFLLIDPDGNRFEVTQSPTASGALVDR